MDSVFRVAVPKEYIGVDWPYPEISSERITNIHDYTNPVQSPHSNKKFSYAHHTPGASTASAPPSSSVSVPGVPGVTPAVASATATPVFCSSSRARSLASRFLFLSGMTRHDHSRSVWVNNSQFAMRLIVPSTLTMMGPICSILTGPPPTRSSVLWSPPPSSSPAPLGRNSVGTGGASRITVSPWLVVLPSKIAVPD